MKTLRQRVVAVLLALGAAVTAPAGGGATAAVVVAGAASTLAVASLVSGCTDDDAQPDSCRPAGVVDPALLAFLSKAKALHHQADLAEEAEDTPAALRALDALVGGPRPGGDEPPPEVREVLADTLARAAELRSHSDYQAALSDVKRGLELAPERTHYRGRLMEVMGVVEQRQYQRLRAQNPNDPAVEAAKKRALDAFEQAVAIQDEVIQRALGDSTGSPSAAPAASSAPAP